MRRTVAAVLLLAAAPAVAADLPPPPGPGAAVEERLFLAAAPPAPGDALGLLAARVDCLDFQRGLIAARLEAGLLARGWNGEADRLWRLSQALDLFETRHIRPMIDPETQAAIVAAFAPAEADGEARARRCQAFGDRFALRRVTG
jgi:hypothetical protein